MEVDDSCWDLAERRGDNKFAVQNGVVTAGSASGICDGAAAVIIAR
jgi:hypothetical protein